jgi:hypothetical protein
MSHRVLVALSALVLVSACADGTGPADRSSGPNNIVGNPPPPAFDGTVIGDFESATLEGRVSRLPTGLSLEREGSSTQAPQGAFRFTISPVEYNANAALTEFWMTFPPQTVPANVAQLIPKPKQGRVVVSNGKSVGSGVIVAFDQANGGWWIIELSNLTQPYDVFQRACPGRTWANCITLNAPVIAYFYPTTGPQSMVYPSKPGFLRFTTQF